MKFVSSFYKRANGLTSECDGFTHISVINTPAKDRSVVELYPAVQAALNCFKHQQYRGYIARIYIETLNVLVVDG